MHTDDSRELPFISLRTLAYHYTVPQVWVFAQINQLERKFSTIFNYDFFRALCRKRTKQETRMKKKQGGAKRSKTSSEFFM